MVVSKSPQLLVGLWSGSSTSLHWSTWAVPLLIQILNGCLHQTTNHLVLPLETFWCQTSTDWWQNHEIQSSECICLRSENTGFGYWRGRDSCNVLCTYHSIWISLQKGEAFLVCATAAFSAGRASSGTPKIGKIPSDEATITFDANWNSAGLFCRNFSKQLASLISNVSSEKNRFVVLKIVLGDFYWNLCVTIVNSFTTFTLQRQLIGTRLLFGRLPRDFVL